MSKNTKDKISMANLTKGYESFIKKNKAKSNGKKMFEKTMKKAIKQRGSK